jgi:Tol biopolymer transport system component
VEAPSHDHRREQLRALFDAAQQRPPEQRADFLLHACPGDPELRAEVETLLNADATGFLEDPPDLSTVSVGTKLGIFELRARVGRGGMGEVWRAHDPRLKRDVAIKVLPTILAIDPDRVARFEREARAASALNHPNIVSVFDVGNENGIYWIVSELIDGESLRDRLSRGMLDQRRALAIAAQVANGLAAAHAVGLVHRDLKPDFGLVKPIGPSLHAKEMTESGMILGTAGYMAPEQVRGEPTDPRADVFSFGVVLYEMLSGKQAFSGVSSVELLHGILKEEPPPLPLSVPAAIDRVVRRCMEKDPGQRFQSAADLAFTLDVAPAASNPATPVIAKSRNAIPWLAFVAALLVAVVLGALLLTRPLPAPRVLGIESLTRDSTMIMSPEVPLLSDGLRLFFWLRNTVRVVQLSVKGGEPVPINLQLEKYSYLLDISPDRTEFLICRDPDQARVCQLWIAPIGGTPRRLGNLVSDGSDSASWSPDGRFLVYSRTGNMFLATRGGQELRTLASFPGKFVHFLRWSPDGAKIRFTLSTVDLDQGWEVRPDTIWEVRPDGAGLHRFLPDWNTTCCGVWTPDGRYFVFLANAKIWAAREKAGLFHRFTDEPNVLEIGGITPYHPLPSPDGKRLFFAGFQPRNEYTRYDLITGRLSSEWIGMSEREVEFSRDGKYISFVSSPERALFTAAADGTQRKQLTSPPLSVSLPRWSPDGKQFAFFGNTPGTPKRVYLLPTDRAVPRQVTHGESAGGEDCDPTWSPDGTSLAFGSSNVAKPEEEFIRVVDLKSGRISALPGSQGMYAPRWSPDGRSIAGLAGSREALVLYDLQTKRQTVLLNEPVGYPNWSKDSKVLFVAAEDGWWRVSVQQKKADRIRPSQSFRRGMYGWFTLSPDGSLITTRDIGSTAIYALDWDLP